MPERLANAGYLALKKEATKGVAVIPNIFVPFYEDTMLTDPQHDEDTPIMGNKMERYQTIQGIRAHKGDFTVLNEPNTLGNLMDMLYTKISTSGAGPYTHIFAPSITTNPNSYTVDIPKGQVVARFMGCEASGMEFDYDKNKMTNKVTASALGSFIVRQIASLSTNTITLETNYDPNPTYGLVATDLVRIVRPSTGATVIDTTVSSITATTVVLASGTGIQAGDLLFIRAQTPTYVTKFPFLWTRGEYRFGADAATALGATQTRMDEGTKFSLTHSFEEDGGSPRSGSFDPASLVRTTADAKIDAKLYFDVPDDFNRFLTNQKRACVIRHFSETGYEFRTTLNNLRQLTGSLDLSTKEIVYQEMEFGATWDPTDAQGIAVTVINNIATI